MVGRGHEPVEWLTIRLNYVALQNYVIFCTSVAAIRWQHKDDMMGVRWSQCFDGGLW